MNYLPPRMETATFFLINFSPSKSSTTNALKSDTVFSSAMKTHHSFFSSIVDDQDQHLSNSNWWTSRMKNVEKYWVELTNLANKNSEISTRTPSLSIIDMYKLKHIHASSTSLILRTGFVRNLFHSKINVLSTNNRRFQADMNQWCIWLKDQVKFPQHKSQE
jgi:hypothetical protein